MPAVERFRPIHWVLGSRLKAVTFNNCFGKEQPYED
jgi:hypothetical protein